ncbi:MAG: DNA polymerase III subunit beta [Rikenellaceae bacterium]
MKFDISSSALLSLLQTTGKVISNKNTLPILDYFLFELREGSLKVTASDLETTFVGKIDVESVESEGVIAAPAKLMLDSLKEFSEQPLSIEVNQDTWEITISWNTGSLVLPGISGASYPALPEFEESKTQLDMDVQNIVVGLNKTVFATADDDLRPVMNGIFVNIEPTLLTFVATDAHKLVKYTYDCDNEGVNSSFILPKKPTNLLRQVLVKEDDTINVVFDSKNVMFELTNYTIVCRQIEGNYPPYNAVIPNNNSNKVIVDRIEMLNAIKRVAVCSNKATNLIKLDIKPNLINLTAQDLDFSVSANESLSCSYEGDSIEIGFKSTFLIEILSNLETASIVVELADSTRAGIFKPIYDEAQSTSVLMLLMPMLINA